MRILVVGAGAIGHLFAGMLTSGGHQVWLLARRQEVVENINRQGITIEQVWTGRTLRISARATVDPGDAAPADLVLMCVKGPQTLQATKDALPAVGDGTVFVTLQNGLGNAEVMASVVGQERVIAGVTSNGVILVGPGAIRHAAMGDTTIGEVNGELTERLEGVAGAFRQSGIKVAVSRSVDSLQWAKLVTSAAMNPLAALLRVRNGQLIERADARALLGAVVREAAAVAEAKGVSLPYPDPVERVEASCRTNSTNKMSMLQDVERGVPTEIDFISGAVVRAGELVGVPTPINWTLMQLVKAMTDPGGPGA
jgi:2-dehydropantoate 2-reductase